MLVRVMKGLILMRFSKSEKWLGVPPKPNFDGWNTREGEVIGWSQYLIDLSSWAAQASIEFSTEIQQSARWHSSIKFGWIVSCKTCTCYAVECHFEEFIARSC